MQATPSTSTSPAIAALLHRARTGMLIDVVMPGRRRDTFDFWQGYAKALHDLQRGAGDELAAKDAALAYEPPRVLRAAAQALDDDAYLLPRVEIEQRLAQAGVEIAAHALADRDVVATHELEDGAVAAVYLHGEHAAPAVDVGDGSGEHGLPLVVAGMDIVAAAAPAPALPPGSVVLPPRASSDCRARFESIGGDAALNIESDTSEILLYQDHIPAPDSRRHPARWWGTEMRCASDGTKWRRGLPDYVMDDFGTLVEVPA